MSQIFKRNQGSTDVQRAVNAVSSLINNNVMNNIDRASRAVLECTKDTRSFTSFISCIDDIDDPNIKSVTQGIVLGVVHMLDPTIDDWATLKKNVNTLISRIAYAMIMSAFAPPAQAQASTPAEEQETEEQVQTKGGKGGK